jgi:NADPH2 dehydrogenase
VFVKAESTNQNHFNPLAGNSGVSAPKILRLGSVKNVSQFAEHLRSVQLRIPCDTEMLGAEDSPLFSPLAGGDIKIGNRIAINPMEGWDATAGGNPTENT